MNKKHIPVRMCIACRNMKSKSELIRIVKTLKNVNEYYISLDDTGKKPGRGAYICKDINCFNLAKKTRKLEKHFSCKIPDQIYEEIKNKIVSLEGECIL